MTPLTDMAVDEVYYSRLNNKWKLKCIEIKIQIRMPSLWMHSLFYLGFPKKVNASLHISEKRDFKDGVMNVTLTLDWCPVHSPTRVLRAERTISSCFD